STPTIDYLPAYINHMQKLLARRGNTPHEAEDLIQEAFLRMHEYCGRGRTVRQPEGFLVRTVLRLAINARRDAHRDLYVNGEAQDLALVIDSHPMPDEVLAADQCLQRLRDALDAVSPRTCDIFFRHRFDGMSYAQIARNIGISVSAVEKHVARALA